MSIENHRHETLDDEERSEGELDSSVSDNDEEILPQQTSQSWTNMLTEQNLSSIMSNALADNTEIIHIDDPIAQQGTNPLTYVFPPGTNVNKYFQRKQKQQKIESKSKRKPNRRDLKNLSNLLNNEKNEDLLHAILDIIGCKRAFQFAHQAIRLYQTDDILIKKCDNGQIRTLGGVYFKMFINDNDNELIDENEREQIKRRNQEIQKAKKKNKTKKKKTKIETNQTVEEN